jgi:hypothetical protein
MAGADGLQTQVDREITDSMRERAGKLPELMQARATGMPGTLNEQAAPSQGLRYGLLCERNPEYLGEYWRQCRALYAGGPRLLRDEQMMRQLFPSHANEAPDVYKERCARAFYIAYAGEIIDHLLAGLAQDPVRLSAGTDEKTQTELALPSWWTDFGADVSPPGGKKQPLSSFAVDCLREMFITRYAWTLVDLPPSDPTAPAPESKLDEERRGLLDPYLCLMPSENVVDWQTDEDTGELEWVLCHWRAKRRDSIQESRAQITERWIYWTREGWERYELTWDPTTPPKKEDLVPRVDARPHAFGVVPLIRMELPEGLHAMGKLESIAREHFNKRCAASWAEFKALFAVLYEFMASESGSPWDPKSAPIPMAQTDPRRATNQIRGQGYTQTRGKDDRAEFIGPEVAPFKEARESCAELMREMHRVMFSMALSADMGSAALQRSGESKQKDGEQIAAILTKVGEIIREGVDALLELVKVVRKEDVELHSTGAEKFDAESVADAITEAVELLNGVPLKSPTFLKRFLYRLYKLVSGPNITTDDLEEIRKELENAITAESLTLMDPSAPPPPLDAKPGQPGDDQGGAKPAAKKPKAKPAAPKPQSRRLYPVG